MRNHNVEQNKKKRRVKRQETKDFWNWSCEKEGYYSTVTQNADWRVQRLSEMTAVSAAGNEAWEPIGKGTAFLIFG